MTLLKKLAALHRKMAGVTEAEALAALNPTVTACSFKTFTF